MKKSVGIGICVGTAALAIAAVVIIIAVRGRMSASSMKIGDLEGTVVLSDDTGKEQTPSVGRRLQDGNILDTKEASKAVVELDDDRLVYMLELSRARFNKTGNAMKLSMESGSTFFYIAKKLAEDESFEIETSTMVIGIRGTSGYVFASEDGPESVTITSGTISVYCNKTDEIYEVHAGQRMSVIKMDGEWIVGFEDIGALALPGEVIEIINSNSDLLEEVINATGWTGEDLSVEVTETTETGENAINEMTVAFPETVVDGVLHHAYYNLKPNAELSEFLDTVIEACNGGADSVIALNEQYHSGDYDSGLITNTQNYLVDNFRNTPNWGQWFRFVYNDYRICLYMEIYPDEMAAVGGAYKVYIIPENGMGYYVNYQLIRSDMIISKTIFGSCPCVDGMFEGEMNLMQHLYCPNDGSAIFSYEYDMTGNVINGLVSGPYRSTVYFGDGNTETINAQFDRGLYVSGTSKDSRADEATELDYFYYLDNSYLIFGGYDDAHYIMDGSNECYPY